MHLALTVVAIVIAVTVAMGIVGVLIDRSTERHVNTPRNSGGTSQGDRQ
ncbi:MAG TPA: hypothetical protein VL173_05240 [Vicinamibacterales bacterium]|jgi:hypothetical protein|nr:hypothetical protein [Vicinamibacterales bacterium]